MVLTMVPKTTHNVSLVVMMTLPLFMVVVLPVIVNVPNVCRLSSAFSVYADCDMFDRPILNFMSIRVMELFTEI